MKETFSVGSPKSERGSLRRAVGRALDRRSSRRGVASPISLQFSERRLLLSVLDIVLLWGALWISLGERSDLGVSALEMTLGPFASRLMWFSVLTLFWFVSAFVFGCYDLGRAARLTPALTSVAAAVVAAWGLFLMVPYVTPVLPTSRLALISFPLMGWFSVGAWRAIYIVIFVRPRFYRSGLVVGAGWSGRELAQALCEMEGQEPGEGGEENASTATGDEPASGTQSGHHHAQRNIGYRLVGFVDDDESKVNSQILGVPVLGDRHALVDIAKRLRPHELVIAITHPEKMHSDLFQAILECREMGIAITNMATLYEQITGRVPIEHAGRALWVALPLRQSATHRFYLALQRLFDIAIAGVGCLGLCLVMPCVWLANRIVSPGPLFYAQERVGMGGRSFQILKFRSMRTDAEKFSGAVWAEENDPRITPVGHFLRKTRLDEVPQFWNVLCGDMSMIGPRPERPHFTEQLARDIPFYRARHAVKPGLTGWAQIRYRYGASVEDSLIKLQYDLYYIKHQNLLLDLEIVFGTFPIVLGFKGR